MCADRRLSGGSAPEENDARKITKLECVDGPALIGYMGLGRTAFGRVEPSDWIARTLNGIDLPVEQTLQVLADAARRQLLPALQFLSPKEPVVQHCFLTVAFVNKEPRAYATLLSIDRSNRKLGFNHTRLITSKHYKFGQRGAYIASVGGWDGSKILKSRREERRMRLLVKAFDRGAISASAVARALARVNYAVHLEMPKPQTVGPKSLVEWRLKDGGGGLQDFNGVNPEARDSFSHMTPYVGRGKNMQPILEIIIPEVMARMEVMRAGGPAEPLDRDAMNRALAGLPEGPDDQLR